MDFSQDELDEILNIFSAESDEIVHRLNNSILALEKNTNDITDEFKFLLKVLIVVGIPSILTFIEPDTGAVLIYFVITIFIKYT